jgi:hypothetical protein
MSINHIIAEKAEIASLGRLRAATFGRPEKAEAMSPRGHTAFDERARAGTPARPYARGDPSAQGASTMHPYKAGSAVARTRLKPCPYEGGQIWPPLHAGRWARLKPGLRWQEGTGERALRAFDELDGYAVRTGAGDAGESRAGPGAGLRVRRGEGAGAQVADGGVEAGDLERDGEHALASFGDEARHTMIRGSGLSQLEEGAAFGTIAEGQSGQLQMGALGMVGRVGLEAEDARPGVGGVVQLLHGDDEVIEPLDHFLIVSPARPPRWVCY